MKCEANFRFATSLHVAGKVHYLLCEQGDVIDLDDEVVAELAIQVPGGLSPFKAKPEPKAKEPAPELPVMVEGLTDTAATRAVAKKPAAKKPAKKTPGSEFAATKSGK